jgi:sarcosine/dimethylglycine N-methyltransferase
MDRATYDAALHRARVAALDGEFVGQESFMTASEIAALAARAGVGRASPGRFLARETGCRHLGVDADPTAVALARRRARGLSCRFAVGDVPPVPEGSFEVVLLLETMLAFPDKERLIRAVAGALAPGGRFAFTLEEGLPLTAAERAAMPGAATVWPAPVKDVVGALKRAGLTVAWQEDHTAAHHRTARALTEAYAADGPAIADALGRRALDDLLAAHALWGTWLGERRVRKLALVAQRP